jgi:hypothetical protein
VAAASVAEADRRNNEVRWFIFLTRGCGPSGPLSKPKLDFDAESHSHASKKWCMEQTELLQNKSASFLRLNLHQSGAILNCIFTRHDLRHTRGSRANFS